MWKKPWIMTQEWHDVLFLHWPVSPEIVQAHIPPELELDLYNDRAWIGLIFFRVKGNRLRLMPALPGTRFYYELNVRTYVTYKGKAGVHFFSLDVNYPFIVKLATLRNFLPYRNAEISIKKRKKIMEVYSRCKHQNTFPETLVTTFKPIPGPIERSSFNQWLTERYYLWTKTEKHLIRVDMRHSPWILQNVDGVICENTMASFLKCNYQMGRPIAHYSKIKKAQLFPPILEN